MVLTYLFRLSEELRNCLEDEDDDNDESGDERQADPEEPPEAILAQTVLYKYAQQVLKNGMAIIGIVPIS